MNISEWKSRTSSNAWKMETYPIQMKNPPRRSRRTWRSLKKQSKLNSPDSDHDLCMDAPTRVNKIYDISSQGFNNCDHKDASCTGRPTESPLSPLRPGSPGRPCRGNKPHQFGLWSFPWWNRFQVFLSTLKMSPSDTNPNILMDSQIQDELYSPGDQGSHILPFDQMVQLVP